jgi:uncharacterized protein DUF2799
MKRILMALVALSLAACASYFKRKECESTNWFEHGKEVAMRGKWLNSDNLVHECRKVEAEISESQLDQGFKAGAQTYCTPENTYKIGKTGDLYQKEFCDGPQNTPLMSAYKKGINDYCAKSNGQNAGASGKKYQNVCPKDLEPAFLVEYRKGRKKYVQAMIDNRQNEVREIDNQLGAERNQLGYNQFRLVGLEGEVHSLETQKSLALPDQSQQQTYIDGRLSALNNDIMILRNEVRREQDAITSLERDRTIKTTEINNFKAELPSLDPAP